MQDFIFIAPIKFKKFRMKFMKTAVKKKSAGQEILLLSMTNIVRYCGAKP